MITALY